MGSRFASPYLSGNDLPKFRTRAEAADFIADYQRAGHIRRCRHVEATPYMMDEGYFVSCAQDAFKVQQRQYLGGTFPRHEFHGCPRPCPYYASTRRAATWRLVSAVGRAGAPIQAIVSVLGWLFAPPLARTLVVVILIALGLASVSPSLRQKVLDGLTSLTNVMNSIRGGK